MSSSSTFASQSSSTPLHTSGIDDAAGRHTSEPDSHIVAPDEHAPVMPVEQVRPPSGLPSSIMPSQSSSCSLQRSRASK